MNNMFGIVANIKVVNEVGDHFRRISYTVSVQQQFNSQIICLSVL